MQILGVPHPRTANPDKMGYEEAINYVGYPCLIKPNLSAGAKGIKIIRNKADFDNYFRILHLISGSLLYKSLYLRPANS